MLVKILFHDNEINGKCGSAAIFSEVVSSQSGFQVLLIFIYLLIDWSKELKIQQYTTDATFWSAVIWFKVVKMCL